ncbi:hypothetical protein HDU91_005438 [Kappamyces sp. JEL0680]|nr:hypothetical protein HDU91_005438 [Kappamyces sp. JEL0680]
MDLVALLPLEISSQILILAVKYELEEEVVQPGSAVGAKQLLAFGLVSKQWREIVCYEGLWREMIQLPCRDRPNLSLSMALLLKSPRSAMKELICVGADLEVPLIESALESSSQDHPTQSVEQTIDNDPFTFWSSLGSSSDQKDEWLDFKLMSPLCLIHSVDITPFLAQYQRGLPCYAPRSVSFSVRLALDAKPVYVSSRYPILNRPVPQKFKLNSIGLGGFLRIHLHGYASHQPGDELYYTAIEKVVVYGTPLGALQSATNLLQCCLQYADKLCSMENSSFSQRREQIMAANYLAIHLHQQEVKQAETCLDAFRSRRWAEGIDIMTKGTASSILRREPFLSSFRDSFSTLQQTSSHGNESEYGHWFRYYIAILYENNEVLTRDEALYLAKISRVDGNARLIDIGLRRNLINCTNELAEVFDDGTADAGTLSIAYHIYCHGRVFEKILETSFKLENYGMAVEIVYSTYNPDELPFLIPRLVKAHSKYRCAKFLIQFLRLFDLYDHTAPWSMNHFYETVNACLGLRQIPIGSNGLHKALQEIVERREIF